MDPNAILHEVGLDSQILRGNLSERIGVQAL
jgi:hypothetical protein